MKLSNEEYETLLNKMNPDELAKHLAQQLNAINDKLDKLMSEYSKFITPETLQNTITEDFCYNRWKCNKERYDKEMADKINTKTQLVENLLKWGGWILFISFIISKFL